MPPCACGTKPNGQAKKWQLIGPDGQIVRTYSSEMDARMAASQASGSRVRPV